MKETLAGDAKELAMSVPTRYELSNTVQIEDIQFCYNSQNKINWFIQSEHNDIYNHQHPSMATCFGPFLDHPQSNIYL